MSVDGGLAIPLAGLQDASVRLAREREFAVFVAQHRERAVRLAWCLVSGDDDAAEDVAQEAFIRAHRGLARFRGDAALSTWFYRILVREAHRHRRWLAVRERFRASAPTESADPSPRATSDPTLQRRIAGALRNLPRRQREIFVLVHLEEFTVREAAEISGVAIGTAKSHLHRALVSLRRQLADLKDEAGGRAHE